MMGIYRTFVDVYAAKTGGVRKLEETIFLKY